LKEINPNIKPLEKITTGLWVFAGLFVLLGIYLLFFASQARKWQELTATILDTKITTTVSQAGSPLILRHLTYNVEVEYAYKFADKTFVGDRYSIGTGTTVKGGWIDKSEARNWLKNSIYQPNQEIQIYVNTNNPAQSVIHNEIHWATLIPFVIALVFAGLAYMLIFLLKKVKE